MNKENVLKSCYSVLGRYTPLKVDCGTICDGKCCGGDDNTGMLLFPGEEALIDPEITVKKAEDGTLVAVCNSSCDRRRRPLSCRIYPLFPVIKRDGDKEYVAVEYDSRAAGCPLTLGEVELDRRFCKAVRRVGGLLLLNEETARFYRSLNEEINEYIELEKLILKKF